MVKYGSRKREYILITLKKRTKKQFLKEATLRKYGGLAVLMKFIG